MSKHSSYVYLVDYEFYKIGVSTNLKKRIESFRVTSPNAKLVSVVRGDCNLERVIFRHFKNFRLEVSECFEKNDVILTFFRSIEEPNTAKILETINNYGKTSKKPKRCSIGNGVFANNLRSLLDSNHVSQTEIGRICGKAPATISEWLSGAHPSDLEPILKLCKHFEVDFQWLLTGERRM